MPRPKGSKNKIRSKKQYMMEPVSNYTFISVSFYIMAFIMIHTGIIQDSILLIGFAILFTLLNGRIMKWMESE